MSRASRGLAALVACATLTACGSGGFPADPNDTKERIRSSKQLRAGVSPNPPYVEVSAPDADPAGSEPELITRYAATLGAEVEWTVGSEEALIKDLEEGKLDIVAAGITSKSPWKSKVSLTRPYIEDKDDKGKTESHVLAVPPGENALLTDLERWLDTHGGGQP
ncbi:transporter substrate-binding domain-containing protein [Actinomycetota bacterium]